jgi:hypothetical protein
MSCESQIEVLKCCSQVVQDRHCWPAFAASCTAGSGTLTQYSESGWSWEVQNEGFAVQEGAMRTASCKLQVQLIVMVMYLPQRWVIVSGVLWESCRRIHNHDVQVP